MPNRTMPTISPSNHSSAGTDAKASTAGSRGSGLISASSSLPSRVPMTLANRLSPCPTTSSMLLMRPSLMLRMWMRPSDSAPTSTKQPKSLTLVTTPPSSCPSWSSAILRLRWSGLRTSLSALIESSICSLSSSFPRMRTVILSPTPKYLVASGTKTPSLICVLCKSASFSQPMSTQAPKGLTTLTRPWTSCPTAKSLMILRPRFFMVSPRKSASAFRTRTLTFCPTDTSSLGCSTNLSFISETCTKPNNGVPSNLTTAPWLDNRITCPSNSWPRFSCDLSVGTAAADSGADDARSWRRGLLEMRVPRRP
mmetsp:Transcript_77858/g.231963  ORF Transcript_77858/g.231963 Transcript_77858/m.231963 type:complete len:310 (-) Transcript_77858:228-1157(-)